MKTIGSIVRMIALWIMMLGAFAADIILYMNGQYVWGTFWTFIILLVIGYEVWGKFISKEKKTISNMWKDWTIKDPTMAYLVLGILYVSLSALCLHLAVW